MRRSRKIIHLALDLFLLILFFASIIFFGSRTDLILNQIYKEYFPEIILVVYLVIVISKSIFGCYRVSWYRPVLKDIFRTMLAAIICMIMLTLIYLITDFKVVDLMMVLFLSLLTIISSDIIKYHRLIFTTVKYHFEKKYNKSLKNVLIIGDSSSIPYIQYSLSSRKEKAKIVGVYTEFEASNGDYIYGTTNLGGFESVEATIDKTIEKHRVEEIIFASSQKDEIITNVIIYCKKNYPHINTYITTEFINSTNTGKKTAKIREIKYEDLLYRQMIEINPDSYTAYLKDKVVLITGGAGSIGSEICNQVLSIGVKKLLIFDFNENDLFKLNNKLSKEFAEDRYVMILGSIRDEARLNDVFNEYRPEIVYHAAAHKHVPMIQINPLEAVKNNIFGTKNLCEAAERYNVEKFILISTDKAVNPTSIMGCTKRIAELLIKKYNILSETTKFSAVRFGNVLGSNGSVVPLFIDQINRGGPVTVTHKDVVRFFMTIPEAVSLVIRSGSLTNGGEIFFLDMGKPIHIYNMAEDLIKLMGLRPHVDIEIKIIGLRDGEKMYEELYLDHEVLEDTQIPKIKEVIELDIYQFNLENCLNELENVVKNDENSNVFEILNNYIGNNKIVKDKQYEKRDYI